MTISIFDHRRRIALKTLSGKKLLKTLNIINKDELEFFRALDIK